MNYTRQQLIEICALAIVPETKWCNRDTDGAMCKTGEVWAKLRAGCRFEVIGQGELATDSRTIWLRVWSRGFDWFEGAVCRTPMERLVRGATPDIHQPTDREELLAVETYYLPTLARLKVAGGGDWY